MPVDVNGIDKLACEQFHLLYGERYDLAVTVLRLTNVYGPRQHLEREGLGFLPVFVRQALLGEEIVLYGDGTQRRDCVHVDDVVDALLLSATTPEAAGEIFNLGHEDSLTLAEIAELTQRAAGDERRGAAACRGPTSCCASTSAASTATSPRPSASSAGRRASRSPTASRPPSATTVDRSWSPSST